MSNEKQAREALEKFFPKPFTDYQWSLISAQGYEEALLSGVRSADEVAEELKDLMEAADKRASGAEQAPLGRPDEPLLTWDEMEKLVLGRILATGETSGPKPTPATPGSGVRFRRLVQGRQSGRRLRWIVGGTVGLFVVALGSTVLLFLGPQCGEGGASGTTSTSEVTQTDVQSWNRDRPPDDHQPLAAAGHHTGS